MKIIILAPYPPYQSPSQRFRFEHYLPLLQLQHIEYSYHSFLSEKTWQILFNKGSYFKKVWGIFTGFINRFFLLFKIAGCEFVYIHREAAPVGPPLLEFIISKLMRKKIIYDFDDAIWVQVSSSANPGVSYVKCTWKVKYICKWSFITTVGNDYLAAYAANYCKNVRVIPTVVNTETAHNTFKSQHELPLTVGWTGTFTNFYNLNQITAPVKRLQQEYDFEFLVIADKDPAFSTIHYRFIKWNKTTEIDDLLCFNIGIMPLNNTVVELGKCGFKAIQYQSLGIPAVVSPVGANCDVVINGETGYWAADEEEWYTKLKLLITDTEKRVAMGKKAREHVEEIYSVKATAGLFLALFKNS
jgi:glycosyltransferase involved in cell wall biosynthesis